MDIFGKIFDNLDPGPRDRLRELELMYGKPRVQNPYHDPKFTVDGDALEAARQASLKRAQEAHSIRESKQFSCAGCGTKLATAGNATHCECPKCHANNELYDISASIGSVDAYETKARIVDIKPDTVKDFIDAMKKQGQGYGKTTDSDDIIDIAYEEV